MPAGYSGTPLVKKLGIKPGFNMLTFNEPENYLSLLEGLPEDVSVVTFEKANDIDFVHFFVKEAEVLEQELERYKEKLSKSGMIWISWPKKASKVPTTVDEALVRKTGLEIGLVDVKICAVDEIWSGLKFVYRVKDR